MFYISLLFYRLQTLFSLHPPYRNDTSNPYFSDYSLLLQKGFRERALAGTDLTLISAAQQAKPNLF